MPTIICGDWNIAHKEIDLKNWKSNQKNSGFLIEERNWMDDVFKKIFSLMLSEKLIKNQNNIHGGQIEVMQE